MYPSVSPSQRPSTSSTDGLDHRGGVQPLRSWTDRGARRDAGRLVLDRTKLARSQFVFTNARARRAVWWQTQQTAQFANAVPASLGDGPQDRFKSPSTPREKYGLEVSPAGR